MAPVAVQLTLIVIGSARPLVPPAKTASLPPPIGDPYPPHASSAVSVVPSVADCRSWLTAKSPFGITKHPYPPLPFASNSVTNTTVSSMTTGPPDFDLNELRPWLTETLQDADSGPPFL